jgi:hypothetical protein
VANKPDFMDRVLNAWWGKVLIGLVIIAAAFLLFGQLSDLEAGTRDRLRVNAVVKFAYELGGKWPVAIVLGLFGTAMAAWGVVQAVRGRE